MKAQSLMCYLARSRPKQLAAVLSGAQKFGFLVFGTDTVESNLSVSKEKYFNENITSTITRPIVEVLVFHYNNYIL
jgi:hypothetical protein